MKEHANPRRKQTPDRENKNQRYTTRDVVGMLHVFEAGVAEVTEEWIAWLRHSENVMRTSDFKFYYRWNGKEYARKVYRSDDISPSELEHYSSMHDRTADTEQLFIERESEALSHERYLKAMASLTDKQRELVHKMFVLGMSKAEIATEEGILPSSVQSRWENVCKKFAKFFE